MDALTIFFVVGVLSILIQGYKRIGSNAQSPLNAVKVIREVFDRYPMPLWGIKYKEVLNELGKNAFHRFKLRGVRGVKRDPNKASRGYDKLIEILRYTRIKPSGVVLSLCCGRGGWEQAIAGKPYVTKVHSFTLGSGPGHEGHEDFTSKSFPGKEKINLTYGDARKIDEIPHDTLLFDGGESHPNYEIEAARFNSLFSSVVMRQISPKTTNFVLKILTPSDPNTMDMMLEIQRVTGKGSIIRPTMSRTTTLETYLVSTAKANLKEQISTELKAVFDRAIENRDLKPFETQVGYLYHRDVINPKPVELLKPLDYSVSIAELGNPLPEQGRAYNHWQNAGVYKTGVKGSSATRKNALAMGVVGPLAPSLPNIHEWELTNTTPKGFVEVFNKKVDVPPVENHKFEEELYQAYQGLGDWFLSQGFKLRELDYDEVEKQANKQGAPGFIDDYENIGDFMRDPHWRKKVEDVRASFLSGKPKGAIFNTMGKREKKKGHKKGSRMIAYGPIATRLLELKVFGNLLKLTKKEMNRFGVGGLGLHDLGQRLMEIWKGRGVSDDIAGFDTRIGLYILSLENDLIQRLGGTEIHKKLYQMYGWPAILIPIPNDKYTRSELLLGRGQRMSGSNTTYSMNTLTRLAIGLTGYCVAKGIGNIRSEVFEIMKGNRDISGSISGDDAVFSSEEDITTLSNLGEFYDDIGFPRKNMMRKTKSPVAYRIEEVEFCSHHYEKITFYDKYKDEVVTRMMPTRDVTEIVAKSIMRIGGRDAQLDDEAWLSAQANFLLTTYPHIRTVRALGFAYKAIVHPNVLLLDTGGFIRPTPWMRDGDILDVMNDVLFGDSTQYPTPNFRVWEWRQVGYLLPKREQIYDINSYTSPRRKWRERLRMYCEKVIYEFSTGGDINILDLWREKKRGYIDCRYGLN